MSVTLTEAERGALQASVRAPQAVASDMAMVYAAVERILADRGSEGWASYAAEQERHAELRERIRALADEYDEDYQTPWRLIRDLRALGGNTDG